MSHSHAHTPFYCEENVYHLITTLVCTSQKDASIYAIFISNPQQQVLLFSQVASAPEAEYVVWDYHVVAAVFAMDDSDAESAGMVFDLDSKLGLPVPFEGEKTK